MGLVTIAGILLAIPMGILVHFLGKRLTSGVFALAPKVEEKYALAGAASFASPSATAGSGSAGAASTTGPDGAASTSGSAGAASTTGPDGAASESAGAAYRSAGGASDAAGS